MLPGSLATAQAAVRAAALSLALLAVPGAAAPPSAPPPPDARIWDVRGQRFVDERDLVRTLAAARYRLLGELHDNAAHHELRARLIVAVAATGERPAVVFEQFALEHDAALRAAQQAGADAEGLADAGRFERKSWDWPLHKPILEAAVASGLPVRAGNLPRTQLRGDLAATIDSDSGPPWTRRFRATPWTAQQEAVLAEKIVAGHCGKLPASALPRVVLAQRARDAAMAQALVDDAGDAGAILIAGNGHVRVDVGVPAYLRAPGLPGDGGSSVSVAFVEADEDDARSPAFPRNVAADNPGFDYLWLTAPAKREDPCLRMAGPSAR